MSDNYPEERERRFKSIKLDIKREDTIGSEKSRQSLGKTLKA